MTKTNNLNISLVEQSQAQKEVTINEAITALEALQNRGIEDKDLSSPPVSPSDGDVYIIATSATGDWLGHENDIAYYSSSWKFVSPNEGLLMWMKDENSLYYFDGSGWQAFSSGSDEMDKLGINATADTTNKLSVESEAVLFSHDGDDIRAKLNKNSTSDTASFLFQNNFSGRAEFGLIGDDNFTLKVSGDGTTFTESFVVDNSSGEVEFKEGISFGSDALADYETGSWTPVLSGETTAGSNSYNTQVGTYTRIGNEVIIEGEMRLNSSSGALDSTGLLEIVGLPFVPVSNFGCCIFGTYANLNLDSGKMLAVQVSTQGGGEIRLKQGDGVSNAQITHAQAADGLRVQFKGSYKV